MHTVGGVIFFGLGLGDSALIRDGASGLATQSPGSGAGLPVLSLRVKQVGRSSEGVKVGWGNKCMDHAVERLDHRYCCSYD